MKRRPVLRWILASALILLVLFGLLARKIHNETRGPYFKPGKGFSKNFEEIAYSFLQTEPTHLDRMWIITWGKNDQDYQVLLFDLQQRKVLGSLKNFADPSFFDSTGKKVLCQVRMPEEGLFRRRYAEKIKKWSFGTIKLKQTNLDREENWIVYLDGRPSKKLSTENQVQGIGSIFQPAPGNRYGFNMIPVASKSLLLDFEKETIVVQPLLPSMHPTSWYSSHEIFVVDITTRDLHLLNVTNSNLRPYMTTQDTTKLGQAAGVNLTTNAAFYENRHGKTRHLFFTDTHANWASSNAPLFKLNWTNQKLELVNQDFNFGWSDSFDETGEWYVYSGRSGQKDLNSVTLRNTKTGVEKVLVPPHTKERASLPCFYRGSLIYIQSKAFWIYDLKTGKTERLFPRL